MFVLTRGFLFYMLRCSMKLKSTIRNPFHLKALCIVLIVFMSIGFSFAGARANSCDGIADCLMCARQLHRHLPGMQTRAENPDCRTAEQNSTCGFEVSQDSEKFYGIASVARSFYPARSGILVGASDEYDQLRISRGLIAASFSSGPDPKVPIYLHTKSLLC
jgi:hypothetical protein